MMKLHTLALAAGLVMSSGAHAITSVSYNLANTATQGLGLFGASIEWVAGISVSVPGPIDHSLTFTITENLIAGSGISDTPLSFTIGNTLTDYKNITGLKAQIFNSNNIIHATFVQNGDADHLILPANTSFTTGNYTLKIGGNAIGSAGGLYTLAAVTAPVPEPETWAMLLVGAGLIGLRMRQRNRAVKQAAIN